MVKIAEHHQRSHPLSKDADYRPTQAWPDECVVQWGARGVVFAKSGNYRTAFFEAFPEENAGGFIRGEGATIAEAEEDAFRRWQKQHGCAHRWGRKAYVNGGAICHNCGAFRTVFNPIHDLGGWKKPLSPSELSAIANGFLREIAWGEPETTEHRRWKRRLYLRARRAGIALPPTPEPERQPSLDDDPYAAACMNAVLEYYLARRQALLQEVSADPDMATTFFHAVELSMLEGEARDRGLIPDEKAKPT